MKTKCPICENEIKTISDTAQCKYLNRMICSPCGQEQSMREFFLNSNQFNSYK
tara:strand:- start:8111 stop:8269 length:159 start_codon:yes stop_codon:yes gene_type:complete